MEYTISAELKEAVEVLGSMPKGGFAHVKGYVQDGKQMLETRVTDRTFISRFSVTKLYERRLEALEAMSAEDDDDIGLFNIAKGELIASLKKTLEGDRRDGHRQGHDAYYVNFDNGVVGHLATERQGKATVLLYKNGLPYVESIMLNALEISTNVKVEGKYKPVKRQKKTIMKRKIEGRLPKTYNMKRLSIKEGKFDALKMGGIALNEELKEII
jgi:hypothetical protein